MKIAVGGWIQALKNGRHKDPAQKGAAPEPQQYKGALNMWFPNAGKTAELTFTVDVSDENVTLLARFTKKGSVNKIYRVLPRNPETNDREAEVLRKLFRAIMPALWSSKEAAVADDRAYAPTLFNYSWRISMEEVGDIDCIFEDRKGNIH